MADNRVLEIILRAKNDTDRGTKAAMKTIGDSVNKTMVASGAGMVVGGLAIAGGLNAASDAAVAYGSNVVTVQRLTGLNAKASSDAAAIMSRYGVEGKTLGMVFKTLSTQIVTTSGAANVQKTALGQMGISTKDASGHMRDQMSVLGDVAEWYKKSGGGAEANALATKVLGRGYMALLPVLANGKAGIDDLTTAAKKNGMELSQSQINAVKNYGVALKDNEDASKGLEVQTGLTILPIKTLVEQYLGKALAWLNQLSPGMKQFVVIGAAVTAAVLVLGGGFLMLVGVLPAISAGFGLLSAVFSAEGIAAGIAWVATLGPIALIIAGVALVAGAVYLIIKNWGAIAKFFAGLWKTVVAGVSGFGASIGKAFTGLWTTITKFFAKWGPGILAVIAPFIGIPLLIFQHWNTIGPLLGKVWSGAKTFVVNGINGIIGFVANMPSRIFDALKNLGGIVGAAVKVAIDWLAKLNPFARHSPSLVDNVIAGAAVIAKHYGNLGGMKIGAPIIGAMSVPSLAFAGAGGSGGSFGGGSASSTNARLVAVLERLERNGVVTNIDGRELSRSLGKQVVQSGRSGAK